MARLDEASRVIDAMYEAPYLAHVTMEPPNATVLVDNGKATLWTGTQVPEFARAAAAHATGLDEDDVTVHQELAGGGFGRRLEADYVAQAAAIAAAVPGTPVQLIWSREDDLRHDSYRPATASRLRAALDADNRLTAFVAHSAGQAGFKGLSRRVNLVYTKAGLDKTTAEGTFDQLYEFPAIRSAHAELEFPIPVGSWRSVGHSHQAFFVESFLDEVALATGQDPLAFRRSLLRQHPQGLALLDRVAAASGWGTPAAPTTDGHPVARGLAMHRSFGTNVAAVAEVSVVDGRPQVHRVVVAVDCGIVVHPSGARQQVEGAVIDGLSTALYGEVRIAEGRIQPSNFHEYPLLRLPETPVIETLFLPSAEVPSGLGEPILPVVAPAVGNAIAALTGVRLRTLPLRLPMSRPAAGATT